jgi:hypothetical protein
MVTCPSSAQQAKYRGRICRSHQWEMEIEVSSSNMNLEPRAHSHAAQLSLRRIQEHSKTTRKVKCAMLSSTTLGAMLQMSPRR